MPEDATTPDASVEAAARDPKIGPRWLVRPAPSPELADASDRKGAQAGMTIAIAGAAAFWAAVGAAVWMLKR